MEGDTKKNQGLDTNTSPSAPNAPSTSATNSVNFSSNDIGRTTVAHKEHKYFTNVKKERKSLKQIFSQPPKQFFTKKRIIIISVICLLIIGIIVAVVFFATHQANQSPNITDEQAVPETSSVEDETFKQQQTQLHESAETIVNESGTTDVIQRYEESLNNSAYSDEQKAALYVDRAYELMSLQSEYGDDFRDQIIADAQKAEELHPSFETARALWSISSYFGDTEAAEKYLKIMQERNPNYEPTKSEGRG